MVVSDSGGAGFRVNDASCTNNSLSSTQLVSNQGGGISLDPPVGSNPFGLEEYKTVAFELVEQCADEPPTAVLVPTARGDLLWGIWQGLLDARGAGLITELPRLVAIEPSPSDCCTQPRLML